MPNTPWESEVNASSSEGDKVRAWVGRDVRVCEDDEGVDCVVVAAVDWDVGEGEVCRDVEADEEGDGSEGEGLPRFNLLARCWSLPSLALFP